MESLNSDHLHIFVSYSHKDTEHLERLKVHLTPYLEEGNIEDWLWDDTQIQTGSKWLVDIEQALQRTDAAVLLISADFLASRFIRENELPPLLEAAEKRGVKIIPVILGPCGFESNKNLSQFQAANKPSQPLSRMRGYHQREAWWAQVAKNIYRAIFAQKAKHTSSAPTQVEMRLPASEKWPGNSYTAGDNQQSSNFSPAISNPQGVVVGTGNVVNMYWSASAPTTLSSSEHLSTEEFLITYKDRLQHDPGIAQLQILGMDNPLSVADIYVKVRLHKDPRPRYSTEIAEQKTQDPQGILQQRQALLKERAGTSMDPEVAIKQYKRCVIVGDPGAGKTTLLKRLTIQSIENQLPGLPILPIYIQLQTVAGHESVDLFDFAVLSLSAYGFPTAQIAQLLEERMNAGAVLLLLDALDETVVGDSMETAEASYKRVAEAIMNFTKRFNRIPIVVTARKAGYFQRAQLVGFNELEILDFLPEEIEQFINKWFYEGSDEHRRVLSQKLISEIKGKPRVAALAANPLLLSLLAITYEKDDPQLPANRAKLYKRCIETLLSRWDASRYVQRLHIIDSHQQQQLLQIIAWHFHCRRLRYFSKTDLLPLIIDFLESIGCPIEQAQAFLKEITSENGLLREQAQDIYGFLHLTLQEYFAADYVNNDVQLLLDHLGDPWWEEVILLFAGQTRDAGPLFAHLLSFRGEDEVPEDIFSSKLILAGRCLAAHPRLTTNRDLRDEVPRRLFAMLWETSYSLIRQQAAEVLVEIGRPFPNGSIIRQLLTYLIGEKSARNDIIECILNAFGFFGSEALAIQLLSMYINGAYTKLWFRNGLAEILSRFGNRSMAWMLFRQLTDNTADIWHRATASYFISKIRDWSVIPSLLSLVTDKQIDSFIRSGIALHLGWLEDPSVVPTLLNLVADPQTDANIAENSVAALIALKDRSVVPELIPLLSNAQIHERVRYMITDLLDELGDSSMVDQLSDILFDPNIETNIQAAIAGSLTRHSTPEKDRELMRMLGDEEIDPLIRRHIAWAFGIRGDQSLLPALRILYINQHIHRDVQRNLAFALVMLGDESAVDELVRLLMQNEFPDSLFKTVLDCIVKHANLAIPLKMLADSSIASDWRIHIASTLGNIGNQSIVPMLLGILADPVVVREVRTAIVETIEKLADDEETILELIRLLPESDIADDMYRAMWAVSRRAGVTVILEGPGGTKLQLVKRELSH